MPNSANSAAVPKIQHARTRRKPKALRESEYPGDVSRRAVLAVYGSSGTRSCSRWYWLLVAYHQAQAAFP